MKLRGIHPEDSGHSFHISSLMDREMKNEELDLNLVKGQKGCCVRIITHEWRESRPYLHKANRRDSLSSQRKAS